MRPLDAVPRPSCRPSPSSPCSSSPGAARRRSGVAGSEVQGCGGPDRIGGHSHKTFSASGISGRLVSANLIRSIDIYAKFGLRRFSGLLIFRIYGAWNSVRNIAANRNSKLEGTMIASLIRRLITPFCWNTALYAGDHEIEQNTITGLYRHRVFDFTNGRQVFGTWMPGLPKPDAAPVDLDEMLSPFDMAQRLAPVPVNDRAPGSTMTRFDREQHLIAMEMRQDGNRLPTTSQQARLREAMRRDDEDRRDAQAEHEALERQCTGRI